ncbi:uncharacterized protein [Gossypium hirsutum]|uniref:DUF4371 domain-containing protein n=1 Tax=Gossypium hirsutum TaxID=3635 RepID=A0A1U8MVR9_GOSHI|nr:uncharacterized protein LOC107941806 [Gossypium hirsutum]
MLSSGLYFKVVPLGDGMSHKIQEIEGFTREEIGDSKFCILVDEAHDESKKEQIEIVLQFADKEGFIHERFFDLVHVKDTTSLAFEKAICEVILHHCLNVDDICGQGYDGASNIHGEWNDLQALFDKNIINLVASSSKQHDQLRDTEASHIMELIESGELETSIGKNQYKSQDILNMMQLVSSTKMLFQKFREHGWDPLFEKVELFCEDQMNSHFNDEVVKLLVLSSVLDLRDKYKTFRVEDIYKLMNDFYPDDFTEQEKLHMKIQLEHFQLDAHQSTELQKAFTVVEFVSSAS